MSSSGLLSPVVLVDDNADDLFVLRQRLLRGGVDHPIVTCEDGEEAMAHLKRIVGKPAECPVVIFLDLRMPRCGGFEVLKWVRAQPAFDGVPVIIVSTSALLEDSARALQLGAAQFLSKYPAPETLAEIVKAAAAAKK